jgi:hypothetical protein
MVGLFVQYTQRSAAVRRDLREQQAYLLVATSTAVIGATTQHDIFIFTFPMFNYLL